MKKLYGITIAMVTPFDEQDQVDYEALGRLTKFLISKGVNCLYPCGTTGEMLHLSCEERMKIAETVVKTAAGGCNVFIHCGAATEKETIALARHAHAIGADGIGVVTPIFLGVNQRELEEFYLRISASVPDDFPIYLYNIPQCASNDISAESAWKLAERAPNIVGIKYSFADINRTIDYINVMDGRFSVLHGCDRALTALLAMGCDGTVSGAAGVFPEPFVAVYKAFTEGDIKRAQELQRSCVAIVDILRRGANMAYFKAALSLRGIDVHGMRKPQLDLTEEEAAAFEKEICDYCDRYDITLEV